MEMRILNPAGCNLSDIRHEMVQTADKIIDTAFYPNGFVLKLTITPEQTVVEPSGPLIKVSDSVYQIPD